MSDRINNTDVPSDLRELDGRLAGLGLAERDAAPAGLEARIAAETSGMIGGRRSVHKAAPRSGVLARLSGRRMDWPMRVAAVIAVMIGGWAVVQGIGGTHGRQGGTQVGGAFNPEEVIDYVFGRGGTADQIQRLLDDTATLENLVGGEDFDLSDQENL